MATGRVKMYNESRGFGFIKIDGAGDVFVHVTAATEAGLDLAEGMRLSFDEVRDERTGKFVATNLIAL